MKLKTLLKNIISDIPPEFSAKEIKAIHSDSRQVSPNSLFVALPGTKSHGSVFVDNAIAQGAVVVVVPSQSTPSLAHPQVYKIETENPKEFLRKILLNFYGNLSAHVKTIGVTGTNGKTTITYLLESIAHQSRERCGVIGTVNYRIGSEVLPSVNTTPGLVENQSYLAQLKDLGIKYCFMEVSSHALDQRRVDLIDFSTAVFTNLTGDHLDYHHDMESYFKSKSLLFSQLSANATAVINVDDLYGRKLVSMTKARVLTYGMSESADICAVDLNLSLKGSSFTVVFSQGSFRIETCLIGQHNIYNILAAVGAGLSQGIPWNRIKEGVEALRGVPGRLQRVGLEADFYIYVDYAHTQDALKNILSSVKKVSSAKIILVFGCGGNRDKTKRPLMGRIAGLLADWSIVTSDNPRDEDPQAIAQEIAEGFLKNNFEMILDRREAIAKALSIAQKGDVVLIAGKGHETYQIFKDKTIHFDDTEIVSDCLLSANLYSLSERPS